MKKPKKKNLFFSRLSLFLAALLLVALPGGCSGARTERNEGSLSYEDAEAEIAAMLNEISVTHVSEPVLDIYSEDLSEAETLADVRTLLDTRTSSYWENHYLFGRLSSQKEKTLGERSKDLIIINTVVPFLYTYGLHKADERMCERAGRFLEELKAESNHIIRSWSDAGLPVVSAADSQALIQLQKEYCDKRKCLYCRFGYEYLKHNSL